jgi:hypothetical protein
MAQIVSLDQMRNTVRRMSARYVEQQMTTVQIDNYINLAYTLHFPEQFKSLKLTKPFSFTTVPNVDTYDFIYEENPTNPVTGTQAIAAPGNIQLTPPVYCQGYLMRYYQDKTTFYNRWPKLSVNQQINTGTGIALDTYSGIITGTPFLRAQLDIFGNVTDPAVIISAFDDTGYSVAFTDLPSAGSNIGQLVDSSGNVVLNSSINYLTGAYSFDATIDANAPIFASVVPYGASRPIEMLFYNQQITLRPVPLQIYQVEFQISQQPTQLIADNSAPELDEWYLFICAIAAKLIYTDFPDPEGMDYLMPIYQEQLQIAQRRSLRQMGSQRVATIFSQPGRPFSSWFFGTEYSGTM